MRAADLRKHFQILSDTRRYVPPSLSAISLSTALGTIMRMMLKFTIPVESGNQAFNEGALGKVVESLMTKLKPEAAYFATLDGRRGGMLFFDITESSQIVEAVEPLFLNMNAAVDLVPVMNGDDLREGLAKASQK